MRLIDADALIDDIKNNLWDWETVDGITATTVLKQTISDIGNQPTIEERKTGKWMPHESIFGGLGEPVYTCDQCGHNIGFHSENFCPNCGARMIQEGEDHEAD